MGLGHTRIAHFLHIAQHKFSPPANMDGNTLLVGDYLPILHTNSLFDDDSSADVTVIGEDEGKQIRAHALLLSSASPVFKRMFEGDWKENEKGVVKLKDFDWSVVRALISLIYSRPVEIREDELAELYKAGHMYDIPVVMKSVARCVSGVRNKECVVELTSCASTLGGDCEDEVHDVCGSYLIKCLNDVVDVGRVPHKTMLAVVKAEETDLSELEVLCGVLEWSRAHKDLALEDQQELFSHIRYGQVPIEDMLEVISKGGFPCGAEFTKIVSFRFNLDPADVLANLPLFKPRRSLSGCPSFKDFFPIAVHKKSADLSISCSVDRTCEFHIKQDLWLVCNEPCTFTIITKDVPKDHPYLNIEICSPSSPPYNRLYSSIRLSDRVTRIHIARCITFSMLFDGGQWAGTPYVKYFDKPFPWVLQVLSKDQRYSGTDNCTNYYIYDHGNSVNGWKT